MFNDETNDKNSVNEVNGENLPSPAEDSPPEDAPAEEKVTEQQDKSDDSSISSDLIRGHINTIILRALYERDKYGYEIISDIEKKSHGQYTLKQPTLYSALKRLETQGYIRAYWKTDEISSGGRRKYFTLTESGKEITEKNLAEWEYSRTIIDNLISDRSFDFSQPAPNTVDFTILRSSVSRVPVVNGEDEQKDVSPSAQPAEVQAQPAQPPVQQPQQPAQATEAQPAAQPAEQAQQPVQAQTPPAEEKPRLTEEEILAQLRAEEERRRAHENYLRLISEVPPPRDMHKENIVPGSDNYSANSFVYVAKPETERDYKFLIDKIFAKALANGSVQTSYSAPAAQPQSVKIMDKGRADGITVLSSSDESKSTYANKTTYDKGITLLKCSAVVFAVILVEFVLSLVFMQKLAVTWAYPATLLIIGVAQLAVFGIMALLGYGKNCVRPTTNGYLSTCVIFTVIAILIICAVSFLLNLNPTVATDIVKMIIIPSVTALNITLFAVLYKVFMK